MASVSGFMLLNPVRAEVDITSSVIKKQKADASNTLVISSLMDGKPCTKSDRRKHKDTVLLALQVFLQNFNFFERYRYRSKHLKVLYIAQK